MWRSSLPPPDSGLQILGCPVGDPAYVQAHLQARLQEEQVLLDRLARLPDPQCAWLVLMYCASPRANHLLRAVPHEAAAAYAADHDQRI